MGKHSRKQKTRKDKIDGPRLVACGKRINGIEERVVDYHSLSPISRAALDNVVQISGKSPEEILGDAK